MILKSRRYVAPVVIAEFVRRHQKANDRVYYTASVVIAMPRRFLGWNWRSQKQYILVERNRYNCRLAEDNNEWVFPAQRDEEYEIRSALKEALDYFMNEHCDVVVKTELIEK